MLVSPGYLLPDYAKDEGAWQAAIAPPQAALGASYIQAIPGDYFEVFLTVSFAVDTSATVANRLMLVDCQDQDGNTIDRSYSPGSQPASTSYGYRFSVAVAAAYIAAVTSLSAPLFQIIFAPGFRLVIAGFNFQAGDRIRTIGIASQRYPTGATKKRGPLIVAGGSPIDVSDLGAFVSAPTAPAAAPVAAPALAPAATAAPAPTTSPAQPAPATQTILRPPPGTFAQPEPAAGDQTPGTLTITPI